MSLVQIEGPQRRTLHGPGIVLDRSPSISAAIA